MANRGAQLLKCNKHCQVGRSPDADTCRRSCGHWLEHMLAFTFMNNYLLALSSAEVHDAWDDGDGHIGFSLGQVERSAFTELHLHKTNVAANIRRGTSSAPRQCLHGASCYDVCQELCSRTCSWHSLNVRSSMRKLIATTGCHGFVVLSSRGVTCYL